MQELCFIYCCVFEMLSWLCGICPRKELLQCACFGLAQPRPPCSPHVLLCPLSHSCHWFVLFLCSSVSLPAVSRPSHAPQFCFTSSPMALPFLLLCCVLSSLEIILLASFFPFLFFFFPPPISFLFSLSFKSFKCGFFKLQKDITKVTILTIFNCTGLWH